MFKKKNELTYRKLLEGVKMGTMVHGEKTLMARFRLEKGCAIPDHNHPHEQTGLLLSGRMVFTVDGTDHDVEARRQLVHRFRRSPFRSGAGRFSGRGDVLTGEGRLSGVIRLQGLQGAEI